MDAKLSKTVGNIFIDRSSIKNKILFLVLIFLLVITAQFRIPIPFTPVPLTLQTLIVLLAGAILGARQGALVTAAYILIGWAGLPVFAGNIAGLTGLVGPTGGYLVGFIVAAFFTGWMSKKVNYNLIGLLITMILASGMILILGALHLSIFLNVDLKKAFLAGILPFIPGDLLKSVIAAFIVHTTRKRVSFLK